MIAAMTVLVAGAVDVATDVAEALDEHKSGGLPQLHAPDFGPQLFWLAVTFVLLYWIMAKVALPRIGEVIEERRDRIQRDLAAAERLKTETDKALQTYEKALSDARGSASAIARQTRDELTAEVDKERKAIEDQLASKLAGAEASIAATKTKALASVKDIAGDTVVQIVSALTNINVTKDEAVRAIPSGSDK
ncbi:F0F1 ATP synthase subunit B family protein [Hyphomicrobium sp.]|uniref:F0F1 ATP synthase subunit B family protein n=1 Tax=Hyphomicrobium sp. TaxID=82 RepID=UPI003F7041D0